MRLQALSVKLKEFVEMFAAFINLFEGYGSIARKNQHQYVDSLNLHQLKAPPRQLSQHIFIAIAAPFLSDVSAQPEGSSDASCI